MSNKQTQTQEATTADGTNLFGSLDAARRKVPKAIVEEQTPVVTAPRSITSTFDATAEDEAATSEQSPSKDNEVDSTDWEKRYSDLKSHYDKTIVPLRNKVTEKDDELKELAQKMKESNRPEIPKTQEELDQFASKYPDVFQSIVSVARMELLSNSEDLDNELKEVKSTIKQISKDRQLVELLQYHPDARELREDPKFLDWYEIQTPTIQSLFNSNVITDLIEGINFYKVANGIKTPKVKKKDKEKAATLVNTKGGVDPEDDGKHQWYASDIDKMTDREFADHEAEIDLAVKEGRFVYDK